MTFTASKQTLTAYLSFLPYDMKVKAGGKFSVTLEGDKTYKAETTVTSGKTYDSGMRYTAKIDGSTIKWKEAITIHTTVSSSYSYSGLTMEIGSWKNDTSDQQVVLGSAVIVGESAAIVADLAAYTNKTIWVCIPGVVKFFHKLTQDEVNAKTLTLPDKNAGSTLKATPTAGGNPYENDWIVALYMGINKNGETTTNATPIYWATGNLIATKTNESGGTIAVFHIADQDELEKQAATDSPYNAPLYIKAEMTDGYSTCLQNAQWNMFGWGDATGLKTSTSNSDYAPAFTTDGESICGNAAYDIARARLGGSWRLPTGGSTQATEIAAFSDNYFPSLSPDGIDWKTGETYTGRRYTYTISDAGSAGNTISNTLSFPAAGSRLGATASNCGSNGFCWSGTVDSTESVYYLDFSIGNAKWNSNSHYLGLMVFPVTE